MSHPEPGMPGHVPVLLEQVLQLLRPAPGQVMADLTAGRGGHAQAIAERLGPSGTLLLMDVDPGNLDFARRRVQSLPQPPSVIAVAENFEHVERVAQAHGLRLDGMLADLGFASTQMDDPSRGLAFSQPGPLDMRLDPRQHATAATLLAGIDERDLADLIYQLGEDPYARRIARMVLERRDSGRLRTTADLAEAVVRAYGSRARQSRVHPATRTFMALRIAVNRELEALDGLLAALERGVRQAASTGWLRSGAVAAIVAFHSLEDRCIKRAMVDWERQGWATRLTRKPQVADETEQAHNPRARSAKLRAVRAQPRNEDDPRRRDA
jgi:16S rRNA (cytosine1402-N4)-methyltransferase